MTAAFRSLGIFNYRVWFVGATVSNVGTWMQRTAQDWIVLTMLTKNDATAVGVTMALQFGPQLFLTPITGLAADRLDRRKLLMATQGAMGTLGLALGVLTITGAVQLWMVYVFAFLLGCASAFDSPVRQTFISSLVPPSLLSNAVGLNSTSFNTARLIGPAVAGVLTAVVGAGWVFLINAITFAGTIGALCLFRRDELLPFRRAPRARGQIREGYRYVRRRSDLILVFVMVFIMGTIGMNFAIYSATMARVAFHEGAGTFGLLSSAFAVGSVVGALFAARRERPRLRSVTLGAAGFGFALVAASLMPTYWTFALVLPLVGITAITMMNNANAYVQTTTDPTLRGRVMSIYMAIVMGGTPVGAPVIGAISNAFGPRWGLVAGAFGGLIPAAIAGVWWIRHRRVRLGWDAGRRWPLVLRRGDAVEVATETIAIAEVEAQKG